MEIKNQIQEAVYNFRGSLHDIILTELYYQKDKGAQHFYSTLSIIEQALKEEDDEMIAIFGNDFLEEFDMVMDAVLENINENHGC